MRRALRSNAAMAVPTLRPRTKPAKVRREELIDAAECLFLAKGIVATSVGDMVATADVAKGGIEPPDAEENRSLLNHVFRMRGSDPRLERS